MDSIKIKAEIYNLKTEIENQIENLKQTLQKDITGAVGRIKRQEKTSRQEEFKALKDEIFQQNQDLLNKNIPQKPLTEADIETLKANILQETQDLLNKTMSEFFPDSTQENLTEELENSFEEENIPEDNPEDNQNNPSFNQNLESLDEANQSNILQSQAKQQELEDQFVSAIASKVNNPLDFLRLLKDEGIIFENGEDLVVDTGETLETGERNLKLATEYIDNLLQDEAYAHFGKPRPGSGIGSQLSHDTINVVNSEYFVNGNINTNKLVEGFKTGKGDSILRDLKQHIKR